jgi:hypothetical protein
VLLGAAVLLLWAGPAAALVATIEIAVPVESQADLEPAVSTAILRATDGARAMGLPHVHVVSAQITGQVLVLTVLAADQMLAGAPGVAIPRPALLVEP